MAHFQATEMYEAALRLDQIDTTASDGLKTLSVVGSNMKAGKLASLFYTCF